MPNTDHKVHKLVMVFAVVSRFIEFHAPGPNMTAP